MALHRGTTQAAFEKGRQQMSQEVELFIHSQGQKPRIVSASVEETLAALLVRLGIPTDQHREVFVFIGEDESALSEAPDVEDGVHKHDPADVSRTLGQHGVRHHGHLHHNRCRHIAVEINFAGHTKRHKFSPATTIAVVTAWARKKFKLDPHVAGEYVLRICGTPKEPRPDEHLGELTHGQDCALCFELVREVTPQG